MVPEKRNRKKVEAFNPQPSGSKHQMMAERSRKVKENKEKEANKIKNRDRMRNAREKQQENDSSPKVKKSGKDTLAKKA